MRRDKAATREYDRKRYRANRGSAEYRTWRALIIRCTRKSSANYSYYGGRGITVCEQWLTSFPAFLAHVGPKPSSSHSIERVDPNKGYEPGNVKWATPYEQSRNKRSSRYLTINGVTKCVADWATLSGLYPQTLRRRLKNGWEPSLAVFTPPLPIGNCDPRTSLAMRGDNTK